MTWADVFWNWRKERQRTMRDYHCPACGRASYIPQFDAAISKVKRICNICGCTVTQPVVAPDLFKAKE